MLKGVKLVMSMETVAIEVEERSALGKEKVKKLRDQGFLIGNVYGKGEENITVMMNYHDVFKHLNTGKNRNTIFTFKMGKRTVNCIPYEIQIHPLSRDIIHVDFKVVKSDEPVKIRLPIHPSGTSIGTKKGGTLDQKVSSVNLTILPTEIPQFLEVDVTNLDISQDIQVKDIPLPPSAKIVGIPATNKVFYVKPGK